MRVQCFKIVSLCLIVFLCLFYFNGDNSARFSQDAKNNASKNYDGYMLYFADYSIDSASAKDDAYENYQGYYMLHFSDYYNDLDERESVNGVVHVRFASFSLDNKKTWYLDYRLGVYEDTERLYVDSLKIPHDREKRTRLQHEMMYMQLASHWGYVKEYAVPIGGCKMLYDGNWVYKSIAAIAFYNKNEKNDKPEVCICFVTNCKAKSVIEECDKKSIRCKNVLQAIDPPPFCCVFDQVNIVSITPLSFSQQNFFRSGAKLTIRAGAAAPYEKELYVKSHKLGEKTPHNVTYRGTNYVFNVYKSGYDKTCVEYTDKGLSKTTCVPSPELVLPKITNGNGNSINIEYQDCKQPSNCNVSVAVGTKDPDMLFSVIKPKINFNDYTLVSEYECEGGRKEEDVSKCNDKVAKKLGYVNNDSGRVKCIVNMPFAPMKYYLKKGNRDFWLSTHKKMLWGYGVVTEKTENGMNSERYVKCNYDSAIDITSMTQSQLDSVKSVKSDLFFDIDGHYSPKTRACKGSELYKYEDSRLYPNDRDHSCKDVFLWNDGISNLKSCKSLYMSDDDFSIFFHDDGDVNNIKPLNPILYGMCISNFPSHEYKVRTVKRKIFPNAYNLHIDAKSTACDFLRIEAWGGGASGVSRSGKSGRAGNYVMGLLRLDENMMKKKLIVDVGYGGTGEKNYPSHSGDNTSVKLCDDDEGKNCTIELIAKGGSDDENWNKDTSKGTQHLAHYRFAPGLSRSKTDQILVPYQGVNLPYGSIPKKEDECNCYSNTLQKNSNKYRGSGGCSSSYNCAQEGANGMVRLTCEKWSEPAGDIKLKDQNECDDSLVKVIEEINSSTDNLPNEVKEFLSKISKPKFCEFSSLIKSISKYSSTLREVLDNKASDIHNLPVYRKELLSELKKVDTGLKGMGINDPVSTLLLYIDAIVFNVGVDLVPPKRGVSHKSLLNYYVLDEADKDGELASDADYGVLSSGTKGGTKLNVSQEYEFKNQDLFSVELKDSKFLEQYEHFIGSINRGVISDQSEYKNNNIVVSWMYIFFNSSKEIFDADAKAFVKLMLARDLIKHVKVGVCSKEIAISLEKLNEYKDKLPLAIQGFINKLGEDKFCKASAKLPEFVTLLNNYISVLYDVVSSNGDLGPSKLSEIKLTISNFRSLVNRAEMSQVFTDVGISSSNVMLLFDASILNWVVSEIVVKENVIKNAIDQLKSYNKFPYDAVIMLRGDVDAMKYGEHGIHKFNILVSWLYVSYLFSTCTECFEEFVKLIFETDITKPEKDTVIAES